MNEYGPETYGERISDIYDTFYPDVDSSTIDFIFDLAHNGKVLELGIGTGRIALPLYKKGVNISGIDASPSMIKHLREKPDGKNIPVVFGDFSEVDISDRFDLIFIVFNTFYALTTQELQLKCIENVSTHLNDKGKFLIEAFVPDISRFDRSQTIRTTNISTDEIRIDASTHDLMNQTIFSQHIAFTEKGTKLYPVKIRYVWPSELDLMAKLSGMKLLQRWGGWKKTPFNSQSGKHISVYELG